MTDILYKPQTRWPGKLRTDRERARFDTLHARTERDLRAELDHHVKRGKVAVVQIAIPEEQWKIDGTPRVRAQHVHPGVIVSFESKLGGPFEIYTDKFHEWTDNLRAIYLALTDLRRIERYGIGNGTEQFAGFRALGSGIAMGAPTRTMTADEAANLIITFAKSNTTTANDVIRFAEIRNDLYRAAAANQHPDRNPFNDAAENMIQINIAYDLLKGLQQ